MNSFRISLALLLLAYSSGLQNAHALTEVPDGLPAKQSAALKDRHSRLAKTRDALNARIDVFTAKCSSVPEGSALERECSREQAEIQAAKASYKKDADAYEKGLKQVIDSQSRPSNDEAAARKRIQILDAQIAETEKQLRGLGFQKAVPDFAWFSGQSQRAQQQMVEKLISQLRGYAIDKSEGEMQEHFFKYADKMSNRDAKRLADQLKLSELDSGALQSWLAAFERKASREAFVRGAKATIDTVKKGGDLFELHENMAKGTVEAQQQAALTVISMLVDHPALTELKAVAAGIYDVGEAGVTIYVLGRGIDQLTTATETELANQKKIVKHMKALVDERNALRQKLAKP